MEIQHVFYFQFPLDFHWISTGCEAYFCGMCYIPTVYVRCIKTQALGGIERVKSVHAPGRMDLNLIYMYIAPSLYHRDECNQNINVFDIKLLIA